MAAPLKKSRDRKDTVLTKSHQISFVLKYCLIAARKFFIAKLFYIFEEGQNLGFQGFEGTNLLLKKFEGVNMN